MGGFLLKWRVPHFSTPLYEYVADNARNLLGTLIRHFFAYERVMVSAKVPEDPLKSQHGCSGWLDCWLFS